MKPSWKRNLGLVVAALVFAFFLIEIGARLILIPSYVSYGRLLGVELPPHILPSPFFEAPEMDRSAPYNDLVVDGKAITLGDLWGLSRPDPTTGHAPVENSRSTNGWWQTNQLGARARHEHKREVPKGKSRILIFGDSFAIGSRLPQEETWSAHLAEQGDQFDIVNFGVDGFGSGQSYLRYQIMRDKLDHSYVMFMLSPQVDLWRDINTRRDVGGNWLAYAVMPRFIVKYQSLQLVPDPFADRSAQDFSADMSWDPLLREHLRAFDRFYFPLRYETVPVIGNSIVFKVAANALSIFQRHQLKESLFHIDSEAMTVTRSIIRAFRSDAESRGNTFILVLLPTERELKNRRLKESHWREWQGMAENLCEPGVLCIDLADALREIPTDEIDTGYDGSHFGPNSSRFIAGLIYRALTATERP